MRSCEHRIVRNQREVHSTKYGRKRFITRNHVQVHTFLDDTGVYQILSWNYQGWHAGGNTNNSYIGFEICESKDYSDKEYFIKTKNKATKLCVCLCQKFNLNPAIYTLQRI